MKKLIQNKNFDEERALYSLTDAVVSDCSFSGPADGESAFKESKNIEVTKCSFSLRYPFWHSTGFSLTHSTMNSLTRAPIWYSKNGVVDSCEIEGVKCLRECDDIKIKNCRIVSPEFGWKCRSIDISDSELESEYFLLDSRDIRLTRVTMKGKYSFQYVKSMEINDCLLNTKDAFWHTENVTVKNSTINGEYLGWYSNGLTLIDCHISGTQPLCYCKKLRLINCTMDNADLSFEYSDVEADINGGVLSVKNPLSGSIRADSIGEIILRDSVYETQCEITDKSKR